MPTKLVSANRKKGWKDIQSKTKRNRKTKLALIILGLVVGLLLISWIIRFTQSLFSPWNLQVHAERSYIWDGNFNINLLVRSDHVYLVSYNPKTEKIFVINIPDETFIEIPGGFGKWQIRSVYELGQSKKDLGGDFLLKQTLTTLFAIPIDGFLDFNAMKPQKGAVEIVDAIRKNTFSGFSFLSSLKTDLTPLELIKLQWGTGAVRFDKIREFDLLKLNVLEQESLLDGTVVFNPDLIRLDNALTELSDPTIIAENKTIAVLNATDEPQLAQKWARLITNLGGNVIITSNAKVRLKNTQVLGQESLTLKRLRQIFGPDCSNQKVSSKVKYDTISLQDEDVVLSRAQINVLIGEDYINR